MDVKTAARPCISALMTTLNSERFILEAVESVLGQTITDFELLILDGGSSDHTIEKIEAIQDKRIHIWRCPGTYRGARLNYGIEKASGEFFGIMDSDDIALPTRFEKQIAFLSKNSDISIVGSWADLINECGEHLSTLRRPIQHEKISSQLFAMNGLCWPTCCWTRRLSDTKTRFDSKIRRFEDIAWYARVYPTAKFANIPEPLMKLRQTKNSLGRIYSDDDRRLLFGSLYTTFQDQLSLTKEKKRIGDISRNIGICSYYYGDITTTRKYLMKAIRIQPGSALTLRYLLVAWLIPAPLLARLRKILFFRLISSFLRKLYVTVSYITFKANK